MKKLLVLALLLVTISCSVSTRIYKSSTTEPQIVVDSMYSSHSIPTSVYTDWEMMILPINDQDTIRSYTNFMKVNKLSYIMTVSKRSSTDKFTVELRVENDSSWIIQ